MPTRTASATWNSGLKDGNGTVKGESGAVNASYSFGTRFGDTPGTNPEELVGAAHSACYSMALAAGLEGAGSKATRVTTTARVTVEKVETGFKVTKIQLNCEAQVPGIDEAKFQEIALKTKTGCPISQALSATPIELTAKLIK